MTTPLTAAEWSVSVYDAAVAATDVFEHAVGPDTPTDECLAGIYRYMVAQVELMIVWAKRESSPFEVARLERLHSRFGQQLQVVQTRLHFESDDDDEGEELP